MGFVQFNFISLISFFFPVSRIPCRAPSATVSRGPWHAWTSRGAPLPPWGAGRPPNLRSPRPPAFPRHRHPRPPGPPGGPHGPPKHPHPELHHVPQHPSKAPKLEPPQLWGSAPPGPPHSQVIKHLITDIVIKLFCVSRVCSM